MANLIAQILLLPEAERVKVIQAVLDSLDPQTAIFIRQGQEAQRRLEAWKKSNDPAYTFDEVLNHIDTLRTQHKKAG